MWKAIYVGDEQCGSKGSDSEDEEFVDNDNEIEDGDEDLIEDNAEADVLEEGQTKITRKQKAVN